MLDEDLPELLLDPETPVPAEGGRGERPEPLFIVGSEGTCCALQTTPARMNPKIRAGRMRFDRIASAIGFEEFSTLCSIRMEKSSPLMPVVFFRAELDVLTLSETRMHAPVIRSAKRSEKQAEFSSPLRTLGRGTGSGYHSRPQRRETVIPIQLHSASVEKRVGSPADASFGN